MYMAMIAARPYQKSRKDHCADFRHWHPRGWQSADHRSVERSQIATPTRPSEAVMDEMTAPDRADTTTEISGGGGIPCEHRPSPFSGRVLPFHAQATPTDRQIILGSDFFQGMADSGLSWLLETAHIRQVHRGQTVFFQADPAQSIFLVLDGWVKVVKLTASGDMTVRRIVTSGGTLAEAPSFATGVYPGTAEAISPARLLEIPTASIIQALGGQGSLAFTLFIGMARQAEKTALKLEQSYRCSTQQRLAAHLLTLLPHGSGRVSAEVHLPYDKGLLALSLGMTPESLSRAFVGLRAFGVRTRHKDIVIDDAVVLRTFCRIIDDSSEFDAPLATGDR
jgi:CRP-like cAMP-binding protein